MAQLKYLQRVIIILALMLPVGEIFSQTAEESENSGSPGPVIEGIAVNHLGAGVAGATVRIEAIDAGEDDPPLATATTGPTGDIRVQLPRPVDGTVRARITKEGYATFIQELDLSDDTQVPWIDAIMQGAATLTGVVRDRLFNEPVKGAHVLCENGGQDFQTTTDAQGRYSFNTIEHGPVSLTVTAKGFGVERRMIRVQSDKAEADIELGPERHVELTIITDDDKPAPDVRVEGFTQPGNGYISDTTGPDGKVLLRGIGADTRELMLRLNGPGYVRMPHYQVRIFFPQAAAQGPDGKPPASMPAYHQELIVHPAGGVKGKVVEAKSGDPIVGVRVIAGREFMADAPMAWTGLDGGYELNGLPPGLNVISFQHVQYATAIHEVHLDQKQTVTTNVQLEPGRPIGGTVVDQDGKPIEQVFISADEWRGYATLGLRAVTDEDGRFSLPNAPEGEIVFSFVKPGYGRPLRQTLASGSEDHRIVLELKAPEPFEPGGPGEARIQPGQPVPEMTLVALDGTTYKLSQLRGKYVFIDVWATWCGPCMAEIDHVKALHTAMKDQADFVLIGISLDTDREALKAAIEEYDMPWPQIFGPKSGARKAFETLNGVAIPYTCLIGPDGTLLAQNLRGEGLTEAVKAAMSQKPETQPGE